MSRSVSAPSSVTNTSPCWNGLIVPGSTLIYGSNFWTWTFRPRAFRSRPSEAAVMPLPRDETTPPVTNTYFVGRARISVPSGSAAPLHGRERQARQERREPRKPSLPGRPRTPQRAVRSRAGSRRGLPAGALNPPHPVELGKTGRALDQLTERAALTGYVESDDPSHSCPTTPSADSVH